MGVEQNQEIPMGSPRVLKSRGSMFLGTFIGLTLAVIFAGSYYYWLNYDVLTGPSSASNSGVPAVGQPKDAVNSKDFELFQQQTLDSIQSLKQTIVSQQADLKGLSDQVSTLASKIDALQSAAVLVPNRPPVTARPAVAVAARKLVPKLAPKPSGPISVRGAPLPAPTGQDDR